MIKVRQQLIAPTFDLEFLSNRFIIHHKEKYEKNHFISFETYIIIHNIYVSKVYLLDSNPRFCGTIGFLYLPVADIYSLPAHIPLYQPYLNQIMLESLQITHLCLLHRKKSNQSSYLDLLYRIYISIPMKFTPSFLAGSYELSSKLLPKKEKFYEEN